MSFFVSLAYCILNLNPAALFDISKSFKVSVCRRRLRVNTDCFSRIQIMPFHFHRSLLSLSSLAAMGKIQENIQTKMRPVGSIYLHKYIQKTLKYTAIYQSSL